VKRGRRSEFTPSRNRRQCAETLGLFLHLCSEALDAKVILEMGTGIGISGFAATG